MSTLTASNLIAMPAPKAEKKVRLRGSRVAFDPNQIRAFLAAAREHSERSYAMFCFGLSHGARVSEISELRLDDIRFESNSVQVRRLKNSCSQLQSMITLPGFNEREALLDWMKVRPEVDCPYVFVSRQSDGQNAYRLHRSSIYRTFGEICKRAGLVGLSKYGSHILRHSAGQLLYDASVDLSSIQIRLGHRSISSTAIYAKPSEAQVHTRVTEVLGKIFGTEQS